MLYYILQSNDVVKVRGGPYDFEQRLYAYIERNISLRKGVYCIPNDLISYST